MKKRIIFIVKIILIVSTLINAVTLISYADSDLKVINDSELVSRTYVNARSAYLETIKLYAASSKNTDYVITDINKDGNPELIIRSGNNESNYNYHFYTFKVSELKYLESINGAHTTLYEMENNKYIYALYAHMNYEQVTLYGLNDNNKLVKKVEEPRQLKAGEEHIGGDVKLEFVKISDTDYLYNNIKDLADETVGDEETTQEPPKTVIEFETTDNSTSEEVDETVETTEKSDSFTNEINELWVDVNDTTNTIDKNTQKKVSYEEYMNNRKQMIIYILIGVIIILVLIIYIMSKTKNKKKQ